MGITGTVATYETFYGGDPNRIHNVQLVAHLVDGKLIAPGATFSFNGATGERSAEKGFLEAPVIINGELQTGLGGGVCQVSTTVFNAAYEAGLPITERTNHALYISHYPLGRDATVNYPDVDLKFVERHAATGCCCGRSSAPSSLTVALYGTPPHRRVESDSRAARASSRRRPCKKTVDATLAPGAVVVDDYGVPAQSTSVRAQGLRAGRQAALRPDLVLELPRRAEGDSRRAEEAEAGRSRSRRPPVLPTASRTELSALTIASTSQPGTRVGSSVAASTVAWAVQPSAISDAVALDRVLVAEARALDVQAACVHEQAVVEPRGLEIADVRLEDERLDARGRAAAGSRLRTARGTRRARPRTRRSSSSCARCPARPSRRSAP